jgi:hypothetical protein
MKTILNVPKVTSATLATKIKAGRSIKEKIKFSIINRIG